MLKRLPQDQVEDESIAAVTKFFNANKWEFNRQSRDKTGIDGEIEIVHGIERTGRFLKCQVKAGKSYISPESETQLRIRLERKYLEHWQKMSVPATRTVSFSENHRRVGLIVFRQPYSPTAVRVESSLGAG